MPFFEQVKEEPLDPILGLSIRFAADPRRNKVNLGAGIYKTADLKAFILDSVKKAEMAMVKEETSKDYLPIDGLPEYIEQTKKLIFGNADFSERIYGAQSVGGTSALALGAHFLKEIGIHTIAISAQSWINHRRIFHDAAFSVHTYPYFDWKKKGIDFSALLESVQSLPERSAMLLQVSCHNPTGCDLTWEQWQELFQCLEQKKIFPFFDLPYQGFGDSLEKDVAILNHFLEKGQECAIAVSHAKNFGLYAERPGVLLLACQDANETKRVASRIKVIIRGIWSNPPCHGARIVASILQNEEFKEHWKKELNSMRDRIIEMRKSLALNLMSKSASSSFDFLTKQKGMFSYTGLMEQQVERLISDYGIYMPKDGRISVAGLNLHNLEYVVDAILAVSQE